MFLLCLVNLHILCKLWGLTKYIVRVNHYRGLSVYLWKHYKWKVYCVVNIWRSFVCSFNASHQIYAVLYHIMWRKFKLKWHIPFDSKLYLIWFENLEFSIIYRDIANISLSYADVICIHISFHIWPPLQFFCIIAVSWKDLQYVWKWLNPTLSVLCNKIC